VPEPLSVKAVATTGAAVTASTWTVAQAVAGDPGVASWVNAGASTVVAGMLVLLLGDLRSGKLQHTESVKAIAEEAARAMAAEIRDERRRRDADGA
jgi:hypothetical protein